MNHRVYRTPDVTRLTGYSVFHLWRLERAGRFPRRFKLNGDGGARGAVGWVQAEVDEWLKQRAASRFTDESGDCPDSQPAARR